MSFLVGGGAADCGESALMGVWVGIGCGSAHMDYGGGALITGSVHL